MVHAAIVHSKHAPAHGTEGLHFGVLLQKGWTALMEAVDKGHDDIALRIIKAGATPHIQHKVDPCYCFLA